MTSKPSSPGVRFGDGQADAVDGDALAVLHVGPVGGEREPAELRPVGDADDADGSLDDAGEHCGKVYAAPGTSDNVGLPIEPGSRAHLPQRSLDSRAP